jgi:GTP cyclohydrolase I
MNTARVEELWRELLTEIGENPDRTGLKDTPKRVARMYGEIFRGYELSQMPKISVFPNGEDGVFYKEMVIDTGYYYSHCEHHVATFFGTYNFGYIPDQLIVGASKIGRVVDFHAAKLQIAERLCQNVVDSLWEATKPKGMILIMEGRHFCKEMRGVKKYNSPFEVIEARGMFDRNEDGCKDEFMTRILSKRVGV